MPFSTSTATMLTTTSMQPITAPKISTIGTASESASTHETSRRIAAKRIEAVMTTRRHPSRMASAPESGIVRSEPTPMQSSSIPSTSSPTISRSRRSGTSGAHVAVPKPPMKKKARAACTSRIPISFFLVSPMMLPISLQRPKLTPFYHRDRKKQAAFLDRYGISQIKRMMA